MGSASIGVVTMKVLLIDLSHLYWTTWHGMGADNNMAAEFVANRVLEMRSGYDAVVACCDVGPSWRKKEFPEYKAGRPEKDPASLDQLRRLRERLERDGIPTRSVEGFEADDIIATLAVKAPGNGYTSVVASGDKDLLQLLAAAGVEYLSTNQGGGWMTPEKVKEKFGVPPERLGDWLALVGDKSDNVAGCPGVGKENATRLLNELGSLANMLETPDGITPVRLRENFIANREQIRLARKLVSLSTDVPIDFLEAIKPPERVAPPKGDAFEGDFEESGEAADHTPGDQPKDVAGKGSKEGSATERPANGAESPAPPRAPEAKREPPEPVAEASTALVLDAQDPRWTLALEPRGPNQLITYCRKLAESQLYRKFPNAEAIMAVVLRGRSMGLDMMTALDGFHVIEGKPSPSAMLIIACVLKSGMAEYFELVEKTETSATWETLRRGSKFGPKRHSFSTDDAHRIGLDRPTKTGKDSNWVRYPGAMCIKQAGVELARMVYPDVVANAYQPDELID